MRILVTSSKGGIGKSTLSAGLALAFAEMGRRVLLIDCDLGGRSLDMFLGVDEQVLFDIGDVAGGRCAPADAVKNPWDRPNLFFCPSPAIHDPKDTDSGKLISAIKAIEAECAPDHVICDTAGMVCAPDIAADFADTALIVSTQQPASVRAAETTAMLLQSRGRAVPKLVISTFEWKSARNGKRAGILDIIDGSGIMCAGVVPYDRALMLAGEAGSEAPKDSPGRQAFMNIAARLEGGSVKLFSGISGLSGKKSL